MPHHYVNIYIHIGLPRTATSFLQQKVFSTISQERFFYNPTDLFQLTSSALHSYDYSEEFLVSQKSAIDCALKQYNGCTVLLSEETFSMVPWTQNTRNNCRRIKYIFPDAKILLGIRYQTDYCLSIYQLCFQKNIFQPIDRYLNFKEGTFHSVSESKKEEINKDLYNTLHIHRLLRFPPLDIFAVNFVGLLHDYVSTFGRENIHTYFFEDFVKSPKTVASSILQFLGNNPLSVNNINFDSKVNESSPPLYCRTVAFLYNFRDLYLKSTSLPWGETSQNHSVSNFVLKLYRHALDQFLRKLVWHISQHLKTDIDLLAPNGMRGQMDKLFHKQNVDLLKFFNRKEIPERYLD